MFLDRMGRFVREALLLRFDIEDTVESTRAYNKKIAQIFETCVNLPIRPGKSGNDSRYRTNLQATEVFFYLKRLFAMHPLSTTKTQFNNYLADIKKKSDKYLLLNTLKLSNVLLTNISGGIREDGLDFRNDLEVKEGFVTRDEFKAFLQKKAIFTNEREFLEFMDVIDPYNTGRLDMVKLEDIFFKDIVDFKIQLYYKPGQIVEKLMSQLKPQQKLAVMFAFLNVNLENDNYLTKEQFFNAIESTELKLDKTLLGELFEFLCEDVENKGVNKTFVLG
jgi:hypothetical protein